MKCEGFPQVGCPIGADATSDMLGYQLCDACADNWRAPPTHEETHTGTTILALREQLAACHEALGAVAAILQQRGQEGWEERLLGIVHKALKGK